MPFDLLFREATIVDGTGSPAYVADVAVEGDRIIEIGTGSGPAHTEVDARGRVLAPGFIDIHTHDDWALLSSPDLSFKTLQGVTTVVTGNCGSSAVPYSDWVDSVVRARPAVNVAPLLGHGSFRDHVCGGRAARPLSANETARLVSDVGRSLDDGAFGLSTGLVYEPGRWSGPDEIAEVVTLVAERDGLYTTHMRSESGGLLDSIAETLDVARRTGVRTQISHLKAIGPENWAKIERAIAMISTAIDGGLDVAADHYPYARGSTMLDQIVSAGAFRGPSVFGHLTGDLVTVASAPHNPRWEGRTIGDIADELGCDVADAAERIVRDEGKGCAVITASQSEDNIGTVLRADFVMIGSDGLPAGSRPHPRLHHTFPRVLGPYTRDHRVVDLVTAVEKMTSMSADRLHVTDRGRLTPGARADLVLFDADQITDTGTYDDPTTVPRGIDGVWVNGVQVVADGTVTGERPGRLLRHSR